MAWAYITSSGKGSLIFIYNVTHDGSSKMGSEIYRNILSANLNRDAIGISWEIFYHAAS